MESAEFEAVYRAYAALVFRYLRILGCPPQDAEDVTQETFVKALLHIDSWRGEGSLSSWLCRIARNTWMTALKRQKREVSLPLDREAADDGRAWEWLDLIGRLPEPLRTVFWKRALGGYSYGELARQYGKSESWARVTVYRARTRLRKMLEEEGENHGKDL